jgi:hypothetical protein
MERRHLGMEVARLLRWRAGLLTLERAGPAALRRWGYRRG